MEPLDDQELNGMLREWQAPAAPARLREAVFPPAPWWRRMWRAEIRIPVPVAVGLAPLIALGLWWSKPAPPVPAQRAEVVTFRQLQPVKELKPRIIRRSHEDN